MDIPCLLIQNKVDLINKGDIDEDEVQKFSQNNNYLGVFQTSAKTGDNVEDAMNFILDSVVDKLEKYTKDTGRALKKERKSEILLGETKEKKKESDGCC